MKHIKAHDVKQTVVRVNHPGRKPLPAPLRREEIILTPAEDVTGLQPVGQEIIEILEYQQGELYVKKYIRPEYIKPTADGTQAKRIIAALPNMPIAKSYVGASLLSHLMVSKYSLTHLQANANVQPTKKVAFESPIIAVCSKSDYSTFTQTKVPYKQGHASISVKCKGDLVENKTSYEDIKKSGIKNHLQNIEKALPA